MRSVSNPPALVPAKLKLKVATKLTAVSVYASPERAVTKAAVRLARSANVRRHRISVGVPGKLGAGVWFVVVCPVTRHRGCASSRAPMAKVATRPSAPVEAHPAPESAHAASATIGPAGGALDATGADGTRFHLVIAANSVPDGTQITMTPVSSLGAGPSGTKFVAGVQLAPEGLVLVHGGTLTISPSHAVPIADQLGYGYDGTGADVHQVPLAPTRAIEIPLAHFSGAGVLNGLQNAFSSTGSAILDKYGVLISQEIAAARAGFITEETAFDDSQGLVQKAYQELMQQEVPPGLNDDDAARKAIKDLLTAARWSALLGDSAESLFELEKPTIQKLLEGIYKRAQQRCADNHDLSQVKQVIEADRTEQLFGFTGHELSEDVQCLRFRIDFDSAIDVLAGSGGSGSWHFEYVAHPTVQPDSQNALLFESGSTFGSYAAASGTITGDDGTTVQVTAAKADAFDVIKFSISVDPADTSPPQLIVDLHSPSETYHGHDPSGPFDDDYTDNNWLNVFNQFHPPQTGWNVLQLERVPGNGELVARGTFSNTSPDGSATEATTIDVFHTPPAYG